MNKLLELTITRANILMVGLVPTYTILNSAGVVVANGSLAESGTKPGLYFGNVSLSEGSYMVEYYEPTFGYRAYDEFTLVDAPGRLTAIQSDVTAVLSSVGVPEAFTVQGKLTSLSSAVSANQIALMAELGAIHTEINSLELNTSAVIIVPPEMERPAAGSKTYRVFLNLYDSVGNPEAPDTTPQIRVYLAGGTVIIPLTNMVHEGIKVGIYYFDVVISSMTVLDVWIFEFAVMENSVTRYFKRLTEIVQEGMQDLSTVLNLLNQIVEDTGTTLPAQINSVQSAILADLSVIKGAGFDPGTDSLANLGGHILSIPNNPLRENDIRLPWPPIEDNKLARYWDVYHYKLTAFEVWAWPDRELTGPVLLDTPQAEHLMNIPLNPLLRDDSRLPVGGVLPTYVQMISDTLQAGQVWNNSVRTLTQDISLTSDEHDHLMAVPTDPIRKDDPRLPGYFSGDRLIRFSDIPQWKITAQDVWTYFNRTLTVSGLTPAEHDQLFAIPLDPLLVTDPRLPLAGRAISTTDDVNNIRLTAAQVWAYSNRSLTTQVSIDPTILTLLGQIPTNPLLVTDPRLPTTLMSSQSDVLSSALTASAVWTHPSRVLTGPVSLSQMVLDLLSGIPQQVWSFSVRALSSNQVVLEPVLNQHLLNIPETPLLRNDVRLPTSGVIATRDDVNVVKAAVYQGRRFKMVDNTGRPFSLLSGIPSAGKIHFDLVVTNTTNEEVVLSPADFQNEGGFLNLPNEFLYVADSIVVARGSQNLSSSYGIVSFQRDNRVVIGWLTEAGLFRIGAGQVIAFSVMIDSPYTLVMNYWQTQRFFDEILISFKDAIDQSSSMSVTVANYTMAVEYLRGNGVALKELTYGRIT